MNFNSIKTFLTGNLLTIVGVVLGGISGYVYYAQIGCVTGTCSITSSPTNSILYGGLMGGLFLNIFQTTKTSKK